MPGNRALIIAQCGSRHIMLILVCALLTLIFTTPLAANVDLDPNAELILDLRLNGQRLDNDILGYQHQGSYFVSLKELVESLQFPIKVDAEAGLAGGWYISEDREFALDLANYRVISGSETITVNPKTVAIRDNDLFVETSTIESWLPLQLQTVIRQLTLNVQPTEKIPLQDRLARMSRGPISTSMTTNTPQLPPLDEPYQFIGHRGTDLRVGYAANQSGTDADTRRNYNYSLLSRGDLGWMTSTVFASGSDSDDLTNARITLERTRFDGPLQMNHIELGDVRSGGGSRGALIRGGAALDQYRGQFADDTLPIRGNTLPDWEVELYRNGVLIDFQVVGGDGRYDFPDVPLVYGENVFELRFYGPFGEERQEQVTHYVGEGMFGLGSFSYEVSATQAEETMLGLEDQPGSEDQGSGIYYARGSLGLARRLTATASVRSYEQDTERLESYSAGLSLSALNAQTRANYRYNPEGLDTASMAISSRTGFLGWGATYQHFLPDRLDQADIPENRTLWQSNLNLNLARFSVPFNLNLRHTEREESDSSSADFNYTLRLPFNSRFSQNVAWAREDQRQLSGTLDHFVTTGIGVSTQTGPWNLRLNTSFFLEPETDLAALSGSARLRVDRSMAMTFDARYLPGINTTTYSAGYNWLFETLMLSPRVSYDTNERWGGSISVSTSFGSRPHTYTPHIDRLSQTDHGGVASRVFMDRNGNGVFDSEDEPIQGANVLAPQGFRSAYSDEKGIAYLPRLSAYRDTDVMLDAESLPELDMTPFHQGNSVTPRPGHWNTIDFPVIRTMELEGLVTRITGRGGREPAGRVTLELTDDTGQVASQQRTAFDGMFIYTNVPPGNYHLQLAAQSDYQLISGPGVIQVSSDGGVVRDLNFLIKEISAPAESLIPRELQPSDSTEEQGPAVAPSGSRAIETTPLSPESAPDTVTGANVEPRQPPSSNQRWLVQFGAFGQSGNAQNLWRRLNNKLANVFTDLKPIYRELEGRDLTALMTVVNGSEVNARAFCSDLKKYGFDCILKGQE